MIFDAVRSELTQSRQQTETLLGKNNEKFSLASMKIVPISSGKLFSSTSIDENTRIDIEQALYLFIRAVRKIIPNKKSRKFCLFLFEFVLSKDEISSDRILSGSATRRFRSRQHHPSIRRKNSLFNSNRFF